MVKPILFNTEMVRAILRGWKSQTRRILRPNYKEEEYGFQIVRNTVAPYKWGNWYVEKVNEEEIGFEPQRYVKPPYEPDDVLYVREAWAEGCEKGTYIYKADEEFVVFPVLKENTKITYHPSIHMPKEAARIWLRVTDVRVERLQDMKIIDALKEGVDTSQMANVKFAVNSFQKIWDSTIKKEDLGRYGWNADPYVWVIDFEMCKKPETEEMNRRAKK